MIRVDAYKYTILSVSGHSILIALYIWIIRMILNFFSNYFVKTCCNKYQT